MSGGAIGGIVGGILSFVIIVLLAYILRIYYRSKKRNSKPDGPAVTAQEPTEQKNDTIAVTGKNSSVSVNQSEEVGGIGKGLKYPEQVEKPGANLRWESKHRVGGRVQLPQSSS